MMLLSIIPLFLIIKNLDRGRIIANLHPRIRWQGNIFALYINMSKFLQALKLINLQINYVKTLTVYGIF